MGERQFPDPIYDGDFAALYGLPPDTKIIGPPMSGTLLTKTPDGNSPMLKYDGPWPPPKKEAAKPVEQTRPAAADPAPPELIPDDSKAIAVCLSPDVCKSPDKPVPYMSWGKASDNLNYSPDVRSNGMVIKRQDSKFSRCYGDEPGVGLGCKSNTVGDVVEPVTSSGIVRANGIWVQRHNDRCTLNNGNTDGEYVYVQSTDAKKAPDGSDKDDRAWYEKAWDWTSQTASDAGKAVGQWVEEHPRTMGAVQAVGGAFEAIGSSALIVGGTAADATVVGAPLGVAGQAVGVAGLVNASDNVSTGLRQMWYGKPQETATVQATGAVVSALGGTPEQVQTAKTIASGGQMVLGGVAGAGSVLRQTGQTAARTAASATDDLARAEAGTVAKEAEGAAESTAKVGGEQGARSTRLGMRTTEELLPEGRVPGVRNGKFEKWFDDLTPEELDMLWENPEVRDAIKDRIRSPGGLHEWFMVSRTPTFKQWGVPMSDIKALRTLTSETGGINPDWVHGGIGSTTAHNELLNIIDNSLDRADFTRQLNNWANYRLTNGVNDLPPGLRLGP